MHVSASREWTQDFGTAYKDSRSGQHDTDAWEARTEAHALEVEFLDGHHRIPPRKLEKVTHLHRYQLVWMLPLDLQPTESVSKSQL